VVQTLIRIGKVPRSNYEKSFCFRGFTVISSDTRTLTYTRRHRVSALFESLTVWHALDPDVIQCVGPGEIL